MTEYLQYGALGVLTLVLSGIFVLGKMFLKNFLNNFNILTVAIQEINPTLKEMSKGLHEQKTSTDTLTETMRKKFKDIKQENDNEAK